MNITLQSYTYNLKLSTRKYLVPFGLYMIDKKIFERQPPRILSVTDLTKSIRGLLETEFPFVSVLGEISNLRQPFTGHLYFTLKDSESQVKAVLFKQQARYLPCRPEDGMQVVCRGRVSVYEPRGEYQIVVDYIDFKGAGTLQVALEKLKNRLAAEGLFEESHKKQLPFLPESIALITSPAGAAVFDFLKVADARFPGIIIEIFPVRVQGPEAADEITAALEQLNARRKAQVIVLCRGGGSLEDLWPFNEEKVARAIYASPIPVVSAVGHEVDFTIADFVADYRAPTPTAAAEAVMPDKKALRDRLFFIKERMAGAMTNKIDGHRRTIAIHLRMLRDPSSLLVHFRLRLDHSLEALVRATDNQLRTKQDQVQTHLNRLQQHSPAQLLLYRRQQVTELERRLKNAVTTTLDRKKMQLEKTAALLDAVSPLAVLGRGYAIARTGPERKVLRNSAQVKPGDDLEILLHKGKVDCKVAKTTPHGGKANN